MKQGVGEQAEQYILGVIEGRVQGKRAGLLRGFLWGLSHIFRGLVQLRLLLYGLGWFRHHALGCQVLSVGNLTVGGTGKTPVVEVFARELSQRGRKVAILSRGYKRTKPPFRQRLVERITRIRRMEKPLVVSRGDGPLCSSAQSGDEPYMLAKNLSGVAVLVAKDRVAAGLHAVRELGCDTLVLDDGFQYLYLKHRLDVVLVDSTNPFGTGHVLPRGILREPVRNIRRAGFIFVTKARDGASPALRARLRRYNPDAEISECRHCPRFLEHVQTGERVPLDWLKGREVGAVSGIAVPAGFEHELERLGARVLFHDTYADHHRFRRREIEMAVKQCHDREASALLTTEKDAVRFPEVETNGLPMYYLRVEIEMLSGAEAFHDWIGRISYQRAGSR